MAAPTAMDEAQDKSRFHNAEFVEKAFADEEDMQKIYSQNDDEGSVAPPSDGTEEIGELSRHAPHSSEHEPYSDEDEAFATEGEADHSKDVADSLNASPDPLKRVLSHLGVYQIARLGRMAAELRCLASVARR